MYFFVDSLYAPSMDEKFESIDALYFWSKWNGRILQRVFDFLCGGGFQWVHYIQGVLKITIFVFSQIIQIKLFNISVWIQKVHIDEVFWILHFWNTVVVFIHLSKIAERNELGEKNSNERCRILNCDYVSFYNFFSINYKKSFQRVIT